jgi:predicted kinase
MFNVCTNCGLSHPALGLKQSGFLVCPSCGHARAHRLLPLLLVGGPAGAGKSTAGALLLGALTEAVVIESDILWRPEFNTPRDGYQNYFSLWLGLSAHIAQSGRPVVLFGAGFAVPHSVEPLPERALFSSVHYLGLTCDDEVLAARLRQRPAWRNTTPQLVEEHVEFNHWLKANAARTSPPVTLLDTTGDAPEKTAGRVAEWIRARVTAGGSVAPIS